MLSEETLATLLLMGYKKIEYLTGISFSRANNKVHLLKPGAGKDVACGTRGYGLFVRVSPLTEGRKLSCVRCLRHAWRLFQGG